jgi:sugar phosphate isomerase/epimerase
MNKRSIGFSTGCFYKMSIFDVLDEIKNSGFSLIEISASPQHLDYHDIKTVKIAAKRINKLGLRPFSFHAPFFEGVDLSSPDQEQRGQSVKEITKAAEAASELGVLQFVIHPSPVEPGRNIDNELHKQRMYNVIESLQYVAVRCRELGMNLLLENMLPHMLFSHIADLLCIIRSIERKNVGICFDTGHANLSGNIYKMMYKLSAHLKMIHANDNNGDTDEHLAPGDGNIDWEKLICKLKKEKFHGIFMLELSGEESRDVRHVMEDAQKSNRLLQSITQ